MGRRCNHTGDSRLHLLWEGLGTLNVRDALTLCIRCSGPGLSTPVGRPHFSGRSSGRHKLSSESTVVLVAPSLHGNPEKATRQVTRPSKKKKKKPLRVCFL